MHCQLIPPHPSDMTTDQRLDEVAIILATGTKRLIEKEKTEKISLDNSPNQWLHGRKLRPTGEKQ
ncbi:MAG: hypothetical protein HQM04_09580 [Magnetococcales bacterium]|nr:hypothetical protein [Magnetococcales bacterium]MBF0115282.1 hypothetical protein [Magnetococcales bacterium]